MVTNKSFVPQRGDVVWITLDPTQGHEQKGRRPGLVISPKIYNQKVGLALVCPISSKVKGYVFEVPIKLKNLESVVLSDQVRSIDWRARQVIKIQKAPEVTTQEVQENIRKLLLD